MESLDYVEVDTPVLQEAAGGAEARPFVTYHNSLERKLFLRIATELHLKRFLRYKNFVLAIYVEKMRLPAKITSTHTLSWLKK
ncbi:Lysine--tRNA ligase [Acorus gramineus]|uniref:Lysine--tRNA ligase n=1 Tax=Acorus gramineus TaxID=55184 RepID=A0AAV9B3P0_ACOGR|nr:Lysine--tRNA ligase [Acorus gramineus]